MLIRIALNFELTAIGVLTLPCVLTKSHCPVEILKEDLTPRARENFFFSKFFFLEFLNYKRMSLISMFPSLFKKRENILIIIEYDSTNLSDSHNLIFCLLKFI